MGESLCEFCRAVDWEPIVKRTKPQKIGPFDVIEVRKGPVAEFMHESSCSVCDLVISLATTYPLDSTLPQALSERSKLKCSDYTITMFEVFYQGRPGLSIYAEDSQPGNLNDKCIGTITFSNWTLKYAQWELGLWHRNILGGNQIDVVKVRKWLKKCCTSHRKCKTQEKRVQKEPKLAIRLIDTVQKRIVPTDSNVQYVALSYVWGGVSTIRLLKQNVKSLEGDKGLESYEAQLPQTIQDAIAFVSMLGERYLWCDQLCIVHDDHENLHSQIQRMDTIYRHAFVTIAAACGLDGQSNLPGVQPGSRTAFRMRSKLLGMDVFTETYDPLPMYNVYQSRGWTFQEQMLSRRTLIFKPKELNFVCAEKFEREPPWFPTFLKTETKRDDMNPLDSIMSQGTSDEECQYFKKFCNDIRCKRVWKKLEAYSKLTEEYSKRQLSYQQDVIDAFTGITSILEMIGMGPSCSGLLEHFFDFELVWTFNYTYDRKRRAIPDDTRPDNIKFPSWAWAAWQGDITHYNSPRPNPLIESIWLYDGTSFKELQLTGKKTRTRKTALWTPHGASSVVLATSVLHFHTTVVPVNKFNATEDPNYIMDLKGNKCGRFYDHPSHDLELEQGPNWFFILLSEDIIKAMVNDDQRKEGKEESSSLYVMLVERKPWMRKDLGSRLEDGTIGIPKGYMSRVALACITKKSFEDAGPVREYVYLA